MENTTVLQNNQALNQTRKVVMASLLGILVVLFFLAYLNFFQFSSIFFIIFVVCLSFLIFKVPESGIHIIILSVMTLERWFSLEPLGLLGESFKIYPLDVVLILTTLAFFLRLNPKELFISKKLFLPIFLFFAAVVFWSILSFVWKGNQELIGSVLKNIIFYSLMFFLILFCCRTEKEWKRIFFTILMGGLILIGFIIFGFLSGEGLWSSYTPLSTTGKRLLAATHAFFLILPLFLLISLKVFKKGFLGKWDFLILFFWTVGLITSLFRNLWLGCVLGMGAMFLFMDNKHRLKLISTISQFLFFALLGTFLILWISYLITLDSSFLDPFVVSIKERILSLNPLSLTDESAQFRLAAWSQSLKLFLNHPLLGIGFGQEIKFELSGDEYQIPVRELHNDYVAFILQMGLVGFATFGILIISILKKSFQAIKRSEIYQKPYLIACFAFLCTFLFLSALGTYWETNFFLLFFWLSFGLVIASENFRIHQQTENSS